MSLTTDFPLPLVEVRILKNGCLLKVGWTYLLAYQHPQSIQTVYLRGGRMFQHPEHPGHASTPARCATVPRNTLLLQHGSFSSQPGTFLLILQDQLSHHLCPEVPWTPAEGVPCCLPATRLIPLIATTWSWDCLYAEGQGCNVWLWGGYNSTRNISLSITCWINSPLPRNVRSRLKEAVFRFVQTVWFAFALSAYLFSWAPAIYKAPWWGWEKPTEEVNAPSLFSWSLPSR